MNNLIKQIAYICFVPYIYFQKGIAYLILLPVCRAISVAIQIIVACLKAGYIEAWGTGIPRIIDACKEAGLPEPEIIEAFGGFQITLFKDKYNETSLKTMGINERQIKAMLYVKEKGSITNSEYQQLNNIGRTTATEDLGELVSKSLLSHSGTGRGSTYTLK